MTHTFTIYFLFLLGCISAFAQEYTVTGKVIDGNESPIAFATVVVKNKDSVLVKGISTQEDGKFKLENITKGTYFIQASYIGNTSTLIPLKINKNINVPHISILLKEQNLEEVVVTLQKPRLVRKADRLVFNIENTALSDSDVWEVLKRTPSVLISGEKIQIKGQGNIGVMINNRKVNIPQEELYNLLSGTSASNVQSIEVITNPPLKHSAEGGMLINIIMRKNLTPGYTGSLYNTYKQGVFAKHTLGTDHYFKVRKLDFSTNYSFNSNKKIARFTDITNYLGTPNSLWTANQNSTTNVTKHNLSLFLDAYLNKKTTLSLSSITVFTPRYKRLNDTHTAVDFMDNALSTSFNSLIFSDRDYFNTSYYADYTKKLNKEGAEISFGSHYTYYSSKIDQDLNTTFFNAIETPTGTNNFITQSKQYINLYHAQIDLITPIGKTSNLEAGLRLAGIHSKSTINQEGFDRTQIGINPTDAGVFVYDEDIFAGYTTFKTRWDKLKLNTGLRLEYTKTMGDLDTNPIKNNSNYLKAFPSFSLQYDVRKKDHIRLYYFRRINRPRYNTINPFQYFESNNAVIEGNPELLPATRNYIALEYTFNKAYGIEVFYRAEKNSLRQQVFQENTTNILRYLSYNIDKNNAYGIDFSLHKNITNYWHSYILVSFANTKNEFVDFSSQDTLKTEILSWLCRARNSITLLNDKSLMADIDYVYYAPTIYGNTLMDSYSNLSISVRKTLWKKKASISVSLSDIFRKDIWFESRVYNDQNNSTFTRQENRLLTLGFRYKFGNNVLKNNTKTKSNAERGRI